MNKTAADQERTPRAIRLVLRHYGHQLKLDWKLMVPGLILPGIGTILVFYTPPLILSRVFSLLEKNNQTPTSELMPYLFLIGGVWMFGEILWRVSLHLIILGETRGMERLYINAMDHLFLKDTSFYSDNFAGSLTKKTIAYARNYEDLIDVILFSISPNVIPLIFISVVLWSFSPWLAIVLLVMVCVAAAIVVPLIRRRQKLVTVRETASNIVAGHISDVISNMNAVSSFAREDFEASTHRNHTRDYIRKAKRSWNYQNLRIDSVISPLYVMTNVIGLAIALTVSRAQGASIGTIFLIFSYYAYFTRVLWEFNRIYRNIETRLTESAQFTELLLDEPRLVDPVNPQPFVLTKGEIIMKDVSFKYHDAGSDHLFRDLNLTIGSGEKIGLVGYSGGGKTTVTKLLLRFMDVTSGTITIDNVDISHIKQTDLRGAIAYVPQEPLLFHRSLIDNVRYGRLDATNEDVYEAARLANAAEFIEKLPKKYDTIVGERGIKLSGGQRQRVAIARAMLKNAPILVLDEATSSLDSESESLIQGALWKLMQGRTAIVIAHRLSTIQKMDRIVVLDQGTIVEEGTHKELLAKKGKYAELWAHQSGGFLED